MRTDGGADGNDTMSIGDLDAPCAPDETHEHPLVHGGLALWTLFLGFAMVMVGNGVNLAVLGVRVGDEGFGLRVSGYVMSCYFIGFLLAPSVVSRLLATVGHIRVFAGLTSIASGVVLIHALLVEPVTWALLRLVFGFCMSGLYVVMESWLNDASTVATRGRTLAIYGVVSTAGLALGQYLIAFVDTAGFTLFLISSLLLSLAVVPVTLAATTQAPPIQMAPKFGLRDLLKTVPTGFVGMFFTGVSHGILLGLSAVYAGAEQFDSQRLAVFLVMPTLGSLSLQWPIGYISDRLPRRAVIFVVAATAAVVCVALANVSTNSPLVLAGMFVLGGCTFPLYSLLLSYTLDWAPPGRGIGASGSLLRVNGAGAIVGPIVASSAMASLGAQAFYWSMFATHFVIIAFVGYRIIFKDALPMSKQGSFVSLPARSSYLAVRLATRPLKASRSALKRRTK